MFRTSKAVWARVVFTSMTTGVFGLILPPLAFTDDAMVKQTVVLHQDDVKQLQESLRDKGYYNGESTAVWGPRPAGEFASIRRPKICRSRDMWIPRLPRNSVSDRNR